MRHRRRALIERWMKRSPCELDALSSKIDLRGGHAIEHLCAVGNKSAWQRVREGRGSGGARARLARYTRCRLKTKGVCGQWNLSPGCQSIFRGVRTRAPLNQPSAQPLLSARPPPVRMLVYGISLVRTRQPARRNLQDRVCDRRQCTNDKRTTNPSSRWLIF